MEDLQKRLIAIKSKQMEYFSGVQLPRYLRLKKKTLELDELFVELTLCQKDKKGTRKPGTVTLKEILKKDNNEHKCRVLVEGHPGYGKTTLLLKLLSDWSRKEEYISTEFDLAFIVLLRNFKGDLWSHLHDQCHEITKTKKETENIVTTFQKKALLLMDGWDEATEKTQNALVPLLNGQFFSDMTVVVTSQTGYYKLPKRKKVDDLEAIGGKGIEEWKIWKKRFQILGVSEEKINEFLKKFLQLDLEELKKKLSASTIKMSDIYECPLFLLLLGVVIQENKDHSLITKTELYKQYFNHLLLRNLIKINKDLEEDFDIFNTEDIISSPYRNMMIKFGKLCLAKLKGKDFKFTSEDLDNHMNKDSEVVEKLGLLTKTCLEVNREEREYYEPIHSSFVGFLAALYLSTLEGKKLKEELSSLFKEKINFNDDHLMYPFLVGLNQSQSQDLFRVLSSVNTNIGLFDTGHCLYFYYLYPLLDEVIHKTEILDALEPFLPDRVRFDYNNPPPLDFLQNWMNILLAYYENKILSEEWKISIQSLEKVDYLNWIPSNYKINRLVFKVKDVNEHIINLRGKGIRCGMLSVVDEDGSLFRKPTCLKHVLSKFESDFFCLTLNCCVSNTRDASDLFRVFYAEMKGGDLKDLKLYKLSCLNLDPELFKLYSPFIKEFIKHKRIEWGIKIAFDKHKNIECLKNNSFLHDVAESHLQSFSYDVDKIKEASVLPAVLFNKKRRWQKMQLRGTFTSENDINKLEPFTIEQFDCSRFRSDEDDLILKFLSKCKMIREISCKNPNLFSGILNHDSLKNTRTQLETVEGLNLKEAEIDKQFLQIMKMFPNLKEMTINLFKFTDDKSVDTMCETVQSLPLLKHLRLDHHMEPTDHFYTIQFLKKLSEEKEEEDNLSLEELSIYYVPVDLSLTPDVIRSFEENIDNDDLKTRHLSEGRDLDSRMEEIMNEIKRWQINQYSKLRIPLGTWLSLNTPLDNLDVHLQVTNSLKNDKNYQSRSINIEQSFDGIADSVNESYRITVEGSSRLVNNIFCYKLLKDWGANKEYIRSKFKMIFYWDANDFDNKHSLDQLFIEKCPVEGISNEDIITCITKYQEEILLILEGFDKMSENVINCLDRLLRQELFPRMSIIIIYEDRNSYLMKVIERSTPTLTANETNEELQWCFNTRILIKMFDTVLDKKHKDMGTKLQKMLIENERNEIFECPVFILSLSIMIQNVEDTAKTKTTMFIDYFNFIIQKLLSSTKQVNICNEFHSTSPADKYIQILNDFGKYAMRKLIDNILLVHENDLCSNGEDNSILDFGILFKASKVYKPLHRSFIEFLAAFHIFKVFIDSGKAAFKKKIETIVKEGLLPTGDSLFFVFLGGLLNDRAWLLFEALLPLSTWLNLENVYFTKIIMEIVNIHSFQTLFQSLLPSFVPSFYTFGDFYFIGRDFCSSPIHSFLLNFALERNLIQILRWNPCHSISINKNITINDLRLNLDTNFTRENLIGQDLKLKCRTLSVQFLKDFREECWIDVFSFIDSIKTDEICFEFVSGEAGLNSSLLSCLHKELTEGSWKEKIINRVDLTFKKKDEPSCFRHLDDLVNKKKIRDGVQVWIERSDSKQEKIIQVDVQKLFYSFVKSKTIYDFCIFNENSNFTLTFDFSRLHEEEIKFKSLKFGGSVAFLNINRYAKFAVEELIILLWGDQKKSCEFISNAQGLKWLECKMNCFDCLAENEWNFINNLEELSLRIKQSTMKVNPKVSNLKRLQVLILNFFEIQSIPSEFGFNFSELFTSLKSFQLIWIPLNISFFDSLVNCVLKSLEGINEETQAGAPHLDEFLIFFAKAEKKFDWDVFRESKGIKGIQKMLRRNLVKRFSWVDDEWKMPRNLPRSLFPVEEKFVIEVVLVGFDPSGSRYSQWCYRWMFSPSSYRITFVHE